MAPRAHGRIQILNEASSVESTGHGSPLPQLVHGGPGRAGGGEELGGLRSVKHYMQRTAIQGSPTMLATISQQWVRGAQVNEDRIHPFRKYFEEIQPGDSLLTPRRTLTEADIVNFACLSGDHFYAHMDKIAACKRKTVKRQRSADEKATGVVEWAVEIFNQHQQAVALYSILTLVARQQGDFPA